MVRNDWKWWWFPAAVLGGVYLCVPAVCRGEEAQPSAQLRRDVGLVDQALRLRVARGDLTAAQADTELQRRAAEQAARASTAGPDPSIGPEHRREAAAYFAHVEQAIRSASSWPTDQPADKYETQAIGQLERARSDYREALREGKDPKDALRLAQQVLAWTNGEKDVPADRDVFAGEDTRVTAALQGAATGGGSPPSMPPAVVAREDAQAREDVQAREDAGDPGSRAPGAGTTLPKMEKVEQPAVVVQPPAPPAVVLQPPAGEERAPETDPLYMPKDEALKHKRKADESEDLETRINETREALKIEPRFSPWWSNLGEIFAEHGRWQEAEDAFKHAVELNPNDPEYRAWLALALLKGGRREEAVKEGMAARALAREQKNEMHASHPAYAELGLPAEAAPPPPAADAPAAPPLATGKEKKTYRKLQFAVLGVKRVKEHEGETAAAGNEFVVVSTVIDRSKFEEDFRGSECKMDRARLRDAADETYRSMESQVRVTVPLRNEDGTLAGSQELPYEWTFEVPEGTRVKTFQFEFADEHVGTGGQDPDENVTELRFNLE
jgi:tetratricopeptide (TPR) repeat protein